MNKLAKAIKGILSSSVGDFIAEATLKKSCGLIGVTPDNLASAQLPELTEKIERSVSLFSGEKAGREVADKIMSLGA